MDRNYYSFNLNDKEHLFYTYRNLSEDEVLEYVECFSFIEERDIPNCSNVRQVSIGEINKRNEALYKKWWDDREKRKLKGEDVSHISIPPRIITVQID